MGLDFPGIVGFFPWGTEPIVFPGLLKASHCMCQWGKPFILKLVLIECCSQ